MTSIIEQLPEELLYMILSEIYPPWNLENLEKGQEWPIPDGKDERLTVSKPRASSIAPLLVSKTFYRHCKDLPLTSFSGIWHCLGPGCRPIVDIEWPFLLPRIRHVWLPQHVCFDLLRRLSFAESMYHLPALEVVEVFAQNKCFFHVYDSLAVLIDDVRGMRGAFESYMERFENVQWYGAIRGHCIRLWRNENIRVVAHFMCYVLETISQEDERGNADHSVDETQSHHSVMNAYDVVFDMTDDPRVLKVQIVTCDTTRAELSCCRDLEDLRKRELTVESSLSKPAQVLLEQPLPGPIDDNEAR